MADDMQPGATETDSHQFEFMLWCCIPEAEREPKALSAYATQHGVDRVTLWRWRQQPGFADQMLALKWSLVKASDVGRIMDAQVRKAVKGNTSAADWVFRVLGLRAGSDRDDEGNTAPDGALAGAQASAAVLNMYVDGQHVEEENARRAGARALMGQFRVLPESTVQEASHG